MTSLSLDTNFIVTTARRLVIDHLSLLTIYKILERSVFRMKTRFARLQFFGPAALLLTVGASEGAAYALARNPTSEALWYVNLKVFEVFQTSYYFITQLVDIPYSQFVLISLPLFALATYGLVAKRQFPLALASNLSFVYAAFLLYCSGAISPSHALTASLTGMSVESGSKVYLPVVLAGASLMSFLVSHFQYLLGFHNLSPKSTPQADHP